MSKKKGAFIMAVAFMTAVGFSGCGGGTAAPAVPQPSAETALIDGVEFDYDNAFFDDFTAGVGYDDWYIGNAAWGNANGGVIPENVNFSDDGELVFTGNGDYYTAGDVAGVGPIKDGSMTGGCLISKFTVRPGRYQVKMKVLPRLGACTAFWTYANRPAAVSDNDNGENDNHEIDIEMPGGKSGIHTFSKMMTTNYLTEQYNQSQDIDLGTVTGETVSLNDGAWHTFGFDWYTDPAVVVYTLDGKVVSVSTDFVPYLEARLWLGVWFPNNSGFVGTSEFETDYMYVDWVSYLPFKDQPYTAFDPVPVNVASASQYPTAPVAKRFANKISNGTFEAVRDYTPVYDSEGENGVFKGWELLSTDEISVAKNAALVEENCGYQNSAGVKVRESGMARQEIDSVYEGFEHRLSFRAKGKGVVKIEYYKTVGRQPFKTETVAVDCADWASFEWSGTAPAESYKMTVKIMSVSDTVEDGAGTKTVWSQLCADDFELVHVV